MVGLPLSESLLTITATGTPDGERLWGRATQYAIEDGAQRCSEDPLPILDGDARDQLVVSDPSSDSFVVVSRTIAGTALEISRYSVPAVDPL